MLDKMKALMDMQRKMQEVRRELEETYFDVLSSDGLVKITMNGAQEVREVFIEKESALADKSALEKSLKDVYNKAIKRSHDLTAQKMKNITGMNIPGLL